MEEHRTNGTPNPPGEPAFSKSVNNQHPYDKISENEASCQIPTQIITFYLTKSPVQLPWKKGFIFHPLIFFCLIIKVFAFFVIQKIIARTSSELLI